MIRVLKVTAVAAMATVVALGVVGLSASATTDSSADLAMEFDIPSAASEKPLSVAAANRVKALQPRYVDLGVSLEEDSAFPLATEAGIELMGLMSSDGQVCIAAVLAAEPESSALTCATAEEFANRGLPLSVSFGENATEVQLVPESVTEQAMPGWVTKRVGPLLISDPHAAQGKSPESKIKRVKNGGKDFLLEDAAPLE